MGLQNSSAPSVYRQVVATAKELDDPRVPQQLELLPDLRFDVPVPGVQLGELVFELPQEYIPRQH